MSVDLGDLIMIPRQVAVLASVAAGLMVVGMPWWAAILTAFPVSALLIAVSYVVIARFIELFSRADQANIQDSD